MFWKEDGLSKIATAFKISSQNFQSLLVMQTYFFLENLKTLNEALFSPYISLFTPLYHLRYPQTLFHMFRNILWIKVKTKFSWSLNLKFLPNWSFHDKMLLLFCIKSWKCLSSFLSSSTFILLFFKTVSILIFHLDVAFHQCQIY